MGFLCDGWLHIWPWLSLLSLSDSVVLWLAVLMLVRKALSYIQAASYLASEFQRPRPKGASPPAHGTGDWAQYCSEAQARACIRSALCQVERGLCEGGNYNAHITAPTTGFSLAVKSQFRSRQKSIQGIEKGGPGSLEGEPHKMK